MTGGPGGPERLGSRFRSSALVDVVRCPAEGEHVPEPQTSRLVELLRTHNGVYVELIERGVAGVDVDGDQVRARETEGEVFRILLPLEYHIAGTAVPDRLLAWRQP